MTANVTVPALPESAPFTPAQRAWLNGFFAGLLGSGASVPEALPATAPAATEEEELPWHDPTLTLDERLGLAEDRPIEHRLMAAMAQLDCGACGYLCRTYSEAIARGEESDLNRCAPGGKPTARVLKQMLSSRAEGVGVTTSGTAMAEVVAIGERGASTTSGIAMASVVAAPRGPSFDRARPFPATLIDCRPLNRPGSSKDTRHVVIGLADSGLTYRPGDSLGVYPENCPELADEVILALGAEADEPVPGPDGRPVGLRDALIRGYDLGRPSAGLIDLLATRATDPREAERLARLREEEDDDDEAADLLDLLARFPTARPDAGAFVRALSRLRPRLYSIASSPREHPNEVHLAVGVVRYASGPRTRKGVASTFLAERLPVGGTVRVFVQPSHRFRLPEDGEAPVVMIGPGTGIAPFRAFLQERRATAATGKNWLFFGDQRRATDFLFEEELMDFRRAGLLTRLDTAFSRDQAEKVYVQHRILDRAAELWGWLDEGAHIYVCGDAKRMAVDVDRALREIVADQGGLSADEAKGYLADLARSGRYRRDVY